MLAVPEEVTLRVGLTTYRSITPWTLGSMLDLARSVARLRVDIESGAFTAPSRCRIADRFLEEEKEQYLLFVDADMHFKVEDVQKLYNALEENPKIGAICGHYAKRSTYPPLGLANWKNEDGLFLPPDLQKEREAKYIQEGAVVPVDVFGAGLLMISKEAMKSVDFPYFEARFMENPHDPSKHKMTHVTEDYDFLHKLRAKGFTPCVHFGVLAGHVGDDVIYPYVKGLTDAHGNVVKEEGDAA